MANLTITLPDEYKDTIFDAFADLYNYDVEVDGTKADFIKSRVRNYIIQTAKQHLRNKAKADAAQAKEDELINLV